MTILVHQAVELEYDQAEAVAKELGLPIDLSDLLENLEEADPVRMVNELHYSNPKFNLKDVIHGNKPLEAFEAVVRMEMLNDRLQ